MEIIGIIFAILIVCAIIPGIVEKYRQGIRDKVAHEVLDTVFNFTNEKEDVSSINKKYGFEKVENKKTALTRAIENKEEEDWNDFLKKL